jgi:hypothetical protein
MHALIEAIKTVGIILVTASVALVATYPLARLFVPPQKGEDI